VKGCCCKIPFKFDGKSFSEPTDEGHQTPWCATEEGCGEAPESIVVTAKGAGGGDRPHGGGYTIFTPPHEGKWKHKRDAKWHTLGEGSLGWWDHVEAPAVVTNLGCDCMFPFYFHGEEHNTCIWAGHDTPWCEVEGHKCGLGIYSQDHNKSGIANFQETHPPDKHQKHHTHHTAFDKTKVGVFRRNLKRPKVAPLLKPTASLHLGFIGEEDKLQTLHKWDNCVEPPPTHQVGKDIEQAPLEPVFLPRPEGRQCGDTKGQWLEPWHFDDMCASGVCNYRCQSPLYCPTCDGGNCACVEPKPSGESCGDGTNRPPDYASTECLSGKCVFDCLLCTNCNFGNCKCE